jgi:hypothetical protein
MAKRFLMLPDVYWNEKYSYSQSIDLHKYLCILTRLSLSSHVLNRSVSGVGMYILASWSTIFLNPVSNTGNEKFYHVIFILTS